MRTLIFLMPNNFNFQDVKRYASFADMLKAESLDKVLPGVKTIEEGKYLVCNSITFA